MMISKQRIAYYLCPVWLVYQPERLSLYALECQHKLFLSKIKFLSFYTSHNLICWCLKLSYHPKEIILQVHVQHTTVLPLVRVVPCLICDVMTLPREPHCSSEALRDVTSKCVFQNRGNQCDVEMCNVLVPPMLLYILLKTWGGPMKVRKLFPGIYNSPRGIWNDVWCYHERVGHK